VWPNRSADRFGFVAGRSASGHAWRKGSGVVMMSEGLVRRWETVYGEYGQASEMVNNSVPGDRAVARHMASASGNVALVWRQMAAEPDMPWWSVAALSAAAQAFEYQARDWTARANYDVQPSAGGPRGRERKDAYPVAVRHTGRHGQGGVADAV
jgi:hypothetical protein